MRILLCLFLFQVSFGDSWIHFKDNISENDAEIFLHKHYLFPLEKHSNPMRFLVRNSFSEEERKKLETEPEIFSVNDKGTALYDLPYYSRWGLTQSQRNTYSWIFGGGVFVVLTTWGSAAWDWGKEMKFGFGSEGWYGQNTYSGGADKFGHMFSLNFQKRAINWILVQMGWDLESANNISFVMAESLGIALEIGDGFSKYLFSFEDLTVDTAGIVFGYFLDRYPWLDELVGFRWEWWPSKEYRSPRNKDKTDITSDYTGEKFYISFKAAGVPVLQERWYTKYLTLDFGYFTKGYEPDITPENKTDGERKRYWTVGMGINLGTLLFDSKPDNMAVRGASTLLKYWIPPSVVNGPHFQIQ